MKVEVAVLGSRPQAGVIMISVDVKQHQFEEEAAQHKATPVCWKRQQFNKGLQAL